MTTHRPGMLPEVASTAPTLIDIAPAEHHISGGSRELVGAARTPNCSARRRSGCGRIDLYLQFDRPLDEQELASIRELVRRRGKGEPVAYITGHARVLRPAVHG